MQTREKYASLKGDNNPMRNPAVAAKQAAALKATWASGNVKPNKVKWTPEMRQQQSERAKQQWSDGRALSAKWSEERKLEHSQKMQAYWRKVRAALAAVGESQHHD